MPITAHAHFTFQIQILTFALSRGMDYWTMETFLSLIHVTLETGMFPFLRMRKCGIFDANSARTMSRNTQHS